MSAYEDVIEPDKLKIISMADVEPQPVTFLWAPYIPSGKITLLQGDPGQGKTMLCLSLAAYISVGRPLPGEDGKRKPVPVLYQTAEDGIADTIHPRLVKMDADMGNVHFIDERREPLSLTDDRLAQAMERLHPALLVIDPLQAYLGAGVDMHRANQVRPVLSHLGSLSQQYDCAVLLVMHMSKMDGVKALYRGLGSIDFNASARSVLMVGCNPKHPEQKILAHAKSNLAAHGESVAFHISDEMGIAFDGFSDLSADQILGPVRKPDQNAEDKAIMFLRSTLKENGYAKLSEIRMEAEQSGIAERTLYRAKEQLNLKTLTVGFSPKKTWWMLPDVDETELRQDQKGAN